MLLIFELNEVTERMLPCGTPSSWLYISDKVPPIIIQNFRFDKNLEINVGI